MTAPAPQIEWTEQQDAQLRQWRSEAVSYKLCGEKLGGISSGAVARRCKALGLPIVNAPPDMRPRPPPAEPKRDHHAQPLKDNAVTLAVLPSLHHPLPGYVACAPDGTAIPATLRPTADEAWRAAGADYQLHRGWHVCRCMVLLAERLDDSD